MYFDIYLYIFVYVMYYVYCNKYLKLYYILYREDRVMNIGRGKVMIRKLLEVIKKSRKGVCIL